MSASTEKMPAVSQLEAIERPILLVANPASRSGKASERINRVRKLMDNYGLQHGFKSTLPEGKTVDLVSKAIVLEGFRTVVYMGGDGTFNQVAKAILKSGRAEQIFLGMLPSGTANDQGKSFGIASTSKAIEENIKVIASGHTTQLDVGEVEAHSDKGVVLRRDLFFDSLGWGLSAAILAFRNSELEIVKKLPVVRDMYRDQMIYIRAAVHKLALSWVTRDRFTAEVTIDGETHTLDRLSDLVVTNTPVYAGDWVPAMDSKHNDGQFEVTPFRGVRDWTSKVILHHKKIPLTEEMVKRIGLSHCPGLKGSDIQIQFLRPNRDKRLLAQLDGEEFPPLDHFHIRVHRGLINLIVPQNYHWI